MVRSVVVFSAVVALKLATSHVHSPAVVVILWRPICEPLMMVWPSSAVDVKCQFVAEAPEAITAPIAKTATRARPRALRLRVIVFLSFGGIESILLDERD